MQPVQSIREWLEELWNDESGVTAVEYGLIAGLVGAVLIVALGAFGDRIEGVFEALTQRMDEAANEIASERSPR